MMVNELSAALAAGSIAPMEAPTVTETQEGNEKEDMSKQFPEGFIWGTSTASYQIEGAAAGGRPRTEHLGHL